MEGAGDKPPGAAREALLQGLAEAIAGIHRQEKAIRERLAPGLQGVLAAVTAPPNAGAPTAGTPTVGAAHAPNAGPGAPARPRVEVDDDQVLGEMLFDLVRLELRVLDQLTTLSLRNADRLVSYLQRATHDGGFAPRSPGEPLRKRREPVTVALAGRAGDSVQTRFLVDNTALRDAEVVLRASDFEAVDAQARGAQGQGTALFRGDVTLRPSEVRLAPGQSVEVELTLSLGGAFSPGRYRGEIEVLAAGRPRRALSLSVEVAAAERPPRPDARPPRKRKR